MEDFFEARTDIVNGEIVGLFGVFDGMNSYIETPLVIYR